jgi:hypothetical protein
MNSNIEDHRARATVHGVLSKLRTNQVRGFGKLPGRNLNSLSTLCISAWIV